MTETAIHVAGLEKRYKTVAALAGVSFAVNKGEIFGLLGPNGAGKTTALHVLLGVLTPSAGEVRVLGMSPQRDRYKIYPRINFSSAYVQMPFNLKARQNLRIFARLYGVKNPENEIDQLLTLFQLTRHAESRTGALSSGEQTRLNLCKSLLNDPEVLFLDEPTASLDPDISELVRESLKKLRKEAGLSIIYTSHNMAEVEDLCDRVLFIHRGKKLIEGTPAEVRGHFQKESLEKVFIHLARTGEIKEREAGK